MGCQYKRAYDNREVKLVIVSESARAVLFKFCTNNLEAYKSPAGKNSYPAGLLYMVRLSR